MIANICLDPETILDIQQLVANFIATNGESKTINKLGNQSICARNLKALIQKKILSDEVIQFMFNIFNMRSHMRSVFSKSKPDFFVSTLFTSCLLGKKLDELNINLVSKWCETRDPFQHLFTNYRKLFFPLNPNHDHWTLVVVDFEEKSMSFFDSWAHRAPFPYLPQYHVMARIFKFLKHVSRYSNYNFTTKEQESWIFL